MVEYAKGGNMENAQISDKPLLTINEAASIYNIGVHKLRKITDDSNCRFVLYVGRKRLIKRKQFEDPPSPPA